MKAKNFWSGNGRTRFTLSLLLICACAASFMSSAHALSAARASALAPAEQERIELAQALLDLQNPWTVMCIAAHPDDEDGATLTLLRRKYGVHTVTLFSTYGEGGQNAIGPELYEELGAIRARETMAAAAIQGSEAHFLALRDFGFSKSADEAFRVWNHEEALRRMVREIRLLRPDVIITNHDTTSGHGHHQATGRLALEAFEAAADPARFPEQLRAGLQTWQPQRLFVRVNYEGGTGSKALEDEAQRASAVVSFNINELDAVRGKTYAEQALEALRQHASQGPWPQTLPPGGRPPTRYRLALHAQTAAPLPANAATVLDGLALAPAVATRLGPPTIGGRPLTEFLDQRDRVLDALIKARKERAFEASRSDAEGARFRLMSERLDRALALAAGIKLTLKTPEQVVTRETPITLSVELANNGARPVRLAEASTGCGASERRREGVPATIEPGARFAFENASKLRANAPLNVPHAEHLYDGRLQGEQCRASASLELAGTKFNVADALQLDVAPPVEISGITPSPLVLTPATANRPVSFKLRLVNHEPSAFAGQLLVGDSAERKPLSNVPLQLGRGETREVPAAYPPQQTLTRASVEAHSGTTTQQSVPFIITRSGRTGEVTRRVVESVYADARVAPNLRVGYVRSYDDTVRDALAALGVRASELSVEDVSAGRLENYDTIIVDNRGYQAHPELVAANARLLDYVRAGGTLIVFYHKSFEWNPDPQRNRPQLAPYPLTLGNARVTEEDAPVTFTEPAHALLNWPNKIGPEDFKGWIQERGLYYPKDWDAHYSAPLSSNDTGEQPLRGGLLTAPYGRGQYIYTSMVWYRQLRAGVPGAYRFFANMLSYGHTGQQGAAAK